MSDFRRSASRPFLRADRAYHRCGAVLATQLVGCGKKAAVDDEKLAEAS